MDSGQTMAVLMMLLTGGFIAAGLIVLKRKAVKTIVPHVRETKQAFVDMNKARVDRYNNLPPLGQARSDKRSAQIAKYAGTGGAGVFIWILGAINPLTLPPMIIAAYWARRNWKEQSNAIEEADQRREQILNPSSALGRPTSSS